MYWNFKFLKNGKYGSMQTIRQLSDNISYFGRRKVANRIFEKFIQFYEYW